MVYSYEENLFSTKLEFNAQPTERHGVSLAKGLQPASFSAFCREKQPCLPCQQCQWHCTDKISEEQKSGRTRTSTNFWELLGSEVCLAS